MKVDVLLGLQWGDEGKGKVVDVLTPEYDVIARFQGGPNAGHTLKFDGIKHVLNTIPSGIFHDKKVNVVGNGVVIDPILFIKEVNNLKEMKVPIILLTAKGEVENRIKGLEFGADDYLGKPFEPKELLLRINPDDMVILSKTIFPRFSNNTFESELLVINKS